MRLRIAMFALCACFASLAAAQPQADEILQALQKKYGGLRDASASFTETTYLPFTQVTQRVSGTIMMKKGNKYRIETANQTIVTDGVTVWRVSPSKKQVLIDTFKEDPKNPTPDRLLFQAPKDYNAIRTDNEKLDGRDVMVLKLTPKSESSNLKSLKLWIGGDDNVILKVETVDFSDTQRTYTISKFSMDSGIADARFTYAPPKGYEVVDLR